MKKLMTSVLAMAIIAMFSLNANAQCTPNPQTGDPGLSPNWQDLECVRNNGSAYSDTIFVENFDTITVGTATIVVDSLIVHSIIGLPIGLSYQFDNGLQTQAYAAGETGCVRLFGSTTCPPGRYKIGIYVTVKTALGVNLGPDEACDLYADAGQTGPCPFQFYVNVDSVGGICDTNAVIATSCMTTSSRNEIQTIEKISVQPNPFNNTTKLSFYSTDAGVYDLRMHDLAGKVVRNDQLNVVNGINSYTITRDNLSEGVYFIMVSKDGKSVTQKVTISK